MPTIDLPPPPPECRAPVSPGDSRRTVVVICCPMCKSIHVVRRTSNTGRPYAWWKCLENGCGYMWKEKFLEARGPRGAIASIL
jgi:hypothetical protein